MSTPDYDDDVEVGCCGVNKHGQKAILAEFRDFVLGGNFIQLAVAFVIAIEVQRLISQFVSSFVTPWFGVIGKTSFETLDFTIRDSTFSYGKFIDALISFLIIALVVFFVLILPTQRYGGKCVPSWVVRKCPHCFSDISAISTRCKYCTSELTPVQISKKSG